MKTIVLVGNPNTGKTTLFNSMTGSRERASNWHGVTVEERSKSVKVFGTDVTVVDLPGTNSINATSPEEKVTSDAVEKYSKKEEVIFAVVCDAGNLEKNLLLALELEEKGLEFVLILNMANEVFGDKIGLVELLEKRFLTKCFLIDGRKRKIVRNVLKSILELEHKSKSEHHIIKINQNEDILTFEQNAEKRLAKIEKLLKNCNIRTAKTEKLDFALTSPFVAIPLFFAVFLSVFWIVFGPVGSFLSELLERYLVGEIFVFVSNSAFEISPFLGELLDAVLVTGFGSVLCFLPQIVLLFLLMSLLEDVGLLARFAYVFDAPFRKIGLSGRSVFSLLTGFGCTTSAVLVTRNLESRKLRKRTALALPFFGCSAKFPVLLVVSSLFFDEWKFLFAFLIYLFSIFLCFLVLFLTSIGERGKREPFLMELPRLRVPSVGKILTDTKANFLGFSGRTLGTVFLCCVIMFFLQSFDFSFALATQSGKPSILESVASFFAPVFGPLGFGSFGVVVALVFGLVAKEMLVSVLALVNGVSIAGLAASLVDSSSVVCFGPASAISFLVFVMLFTPCIPSLQMIKCEIGAKYALFCAVFQFVLAWICAFCTYQLALGNLIVLWILIAIVIAIFVYVVLKWRAYRNCGGCYGCFGGTCSQKRTNKTF